MAKPGSLKDSLKKKTAENPSAPETIAAATGALAVGPGEPKRLNVNVPADLYERFKEKADREGHTLTWLVKRWLEDYVDGAR